jgi:hypothetical protein
LTKYVATKSGQYTQKSCLLTLCPFSYEKLQAFHHMLHYKKGCIVPEERTSSQRATADMKLRVQAAGISTAECAMNSNAPWRKDLRHRFQERFHSRGGSILRGTVSDCPIAISSIQPQLRRSGEKKCGRLIRK